MAKSTTRRGIAPPRAAAKSRKPASSDVEVVEESPGLGLDAGIAVLTSLVLVAAIVLIDMLQAKNGDGLLF